MSHRRFFLSPILGCLLHGGATFAAQATQNVELCVEVATCLDVDPGEVRRFIEADLAVSVREPSACNEGSTQAAADCHNPMTALLVKDPVTGKSLTRSLDLSTTPRVARTRMLAAALAELVWVSWTELVTNPSPRVPAPAPSSVRDSAREVARSHSAAEADWTLGARVSSRAFPTASLLAWGAGVSLAHFVRGGFGIEGDVLAERAQTRTELGTITYEAATVGVGLWWVRPTAWGDLRWGGGMRSGVAWFSAEPDDAMSVHARRLSGIWASPLVAAALGWSLGERMTLLSSFSAGYTLAGLEARIAGSSRAAARGPWLGLTLGLTRMF